MNSATTVRRFRAAAILLAALPVGGFSVYAMRHYVADQLAAARPAPPPPAPTVITVPVLVAKRDLERGALISSETIAVRDIPKAFVSTAALSPDRFDALVGLRLDVALQAGEALVGHVLARPDSTQFSARLPDGARALTLAVDEVNAMSGLLQPGDRIDMHYSARPPLGRDGLAAAEVTMPLLQDVLVLATGRRSRPSGDDSANRSHSTITVQVDPQQAQKLIVAQRAGRITALLRGNDDRAQTKQLAMDSHSLVGARPPALRTVTGPEIIIGGRGLLTSRSSLGVGHVEPK